MKQTLIENARLVDPVSGQESEKESEQESEQEFEQGSDEYPLGALLIEDGKIAAHNDEALSKVAEGALRIDAGGLVLAPGLVDMRVQLREPGEEHKETIVSAVAAAAAGGVTSMVCLPTTQPVIDDVSVVEFVARRGREQKGCKIYCYAAATRGMRGEQISEMGLLQASGALGFTDGEHVIQNTRVMSRVLTYARGFNALVIQHAEDRELAEGGDMNQGALADQLGLVGIPASAEAIIVERDLRLLEGIKGGRCHFAHLTTEAALNAVRRAKKKGLRVSCDTAPHYFCLDERALTGYRTFAKVTPPLRSDADRRAVVAALQDGTIDCIASDHSPQDQDSKRLPLPLAACGMIGLETTLALCITHLKELSLAQIFRKLATNPARLLGIRGGTLQVGEPADLLLCDPGRSWVIREEEMRSKSKNTAFHEVEVRGLVMKTWVDGRVVFDRDKEKEKAQEKAQENKEAQEKAQEKAQERAKERAQEKTQEKTKGAFV